MLRQSPAQQRARLLRALSRALPSVVTGLGHLLTLLWLVGGPLGLSVLGLLCDLVDGWTARRLQVESEFGSLYDWTVDVTITVLVLQRLGLVPLVLILVPVVVYCRTRRWPPTGRWVITLYALSKELLCREWAR